MLRIPHCLDNRLTDGGEVVSLTRRPAALCPREDSWYMIISVRVCLNLRVSAAGTIRLMGKNAMSF
jgi:hypothetical protein